VFDDTVFVDCPMLRSLDGLSSLKTIGRDFVLRNLRSLTSTAALGNLTSVGELPAVCQGVCSKEHCGRAWHAMASSDDKQLLDVHEDHLGHGVSWHCRASACAAQPLGHRVAWQMRQGSSTDSSDMCA
jgi:hypothetical protein